MRHVSDEDRRLFEAKAAPEFAEKVAQAQAARASDEGDIPDFDEMMLELTSTFYQGGPEVYAEIVFEHMNQLAVASKMNDEFKRVLIAGLGLGAETNPECAALLGSMYQAGAIVAKDVPKAVGLLKDAASMGYIEAVVELGKIYYGCTLGDPDYIRAYTYYSFAAAASDDMRAIAKMGEMFYDGHGVLQDKRAAITLWHRVLEEADDEMLAIDTALRLGKILIDAEECMAMGFVTDALQALRLFQRAEVALRAIDELDETQAAKLQEAIDGQSSARVLL